MSMFQRCLGLLRSLLEHYTISLSLYFNIYLFIFLINRYFKGNENCIGLYAKIILTSNGYTCTGPNLVDTPCMVQRTCYVELFKQNYQCSGECQ